MLFCMSVCLHWESRTTDSTIKELSCKVIAHGYLDDMINCLQDGNAVNFGDMNYMSCSGVLSMVIKQ